MLDEFMMRATLAGIGIAFAAAPRAVSTCGSARPTSATRPLMSRCFDCGTQSYRVVSQSSPICEKYSYSLIQSVKKKSLAPVRSIREDRVTSFLTGLSIQISCQVLSKTATAKNEKAPRNFHCPEYPLRFHMCLLYCRHATSMW